MPYTTQSFIRLNDGEFMDFDNSYGAQCVDLFNYYKQQVIGGGWVGTPSTGGAAYLWNDFAGDAGDYFDKIANTPEGVPQYGDVMIWRANEPGVTGPAGHVGIFTSGDTNSFVVFNQNYPNNSPSHFQAFPNYAGVIGWLRPKSFLVGLYDQPILPETPPPAPAPEQVPAIVPPVPESHPSPVVDTPPPVIAPVEPAPIELTVIPEPIILPPSTLPLTPPIVIAHTVGMTTNLLQRITSRKLWVAIALIITLAINHQFDQAVVVVLGYLGVQGYVDATK